MLRKYFIFFDDLIVKSYFCLILIKKNIKNEENYYLFRCFVIC